MNFINEKHHYGSSAVTTATCFRIQYALYQTLQTPSLSTNELKFVSHLSDLLYPESLKLKLENAMQEAMQYYLEPANSE